MLSFKNLYNSDFSNYGFTLSKVLGIIPLGKNKLDTKQGLFRFGDSLYRRVFRLVVPTGKNSKIQEQDIDILNMVIYGHTRIANFGINLKVTAVKASFRPYSNEMVRPHVLP